MSQRSTNRTGLRYRAGNEPRLKVGTSYSGSSPFPSSSMKFIGFPHAGGYGEETTSSRKYHRHQPPTLFLILIVWLDVLKLLNFCVETYFELRISFLSSIAHKLFILELPSRGVREELQRRPSSGIPDDFLYTLDSPFAADMTEAATPASEVLHCQQLRLVCHPQ